MRLLLAAAAGKTVGTWTRRTYRRTATRWVECTVQWTERQTPWILSAWRYPSEDYVYILQRHPVKRKKEGEGGGAQALQRTHSSVQPDRQKPINLGLSVLEWAWICAPLCTSWPTTWRRHDVSCRVRKILSNRPTTSQIPLGKEGKGDRNHAVGQTHSKSRLPTGLVKSEQSVPIIWGNTNLTKRTSNFTCKTPAFVYSYSWLVICFTTKRNYLLSQFLRALNSVISSR